MKFSSPTRACGNQKMVWKHIYSSFRQARRNYHYAHRIGLTMQERKALLEQAKAAERRCESDPLYFLFSDALPYACNRPRFYSTAQRLAYERFIISLSLTSTPALACA